ncbi:RTA1 like protein-domain-containing protein [Triangularia setosa]|uniref:RTA1 like protein-domain-containing protein n=1 Tax=Triangularia setosa TaxID=2587417 RepID=A0AAN6WBD3_9PEZI|nr:RTA1 like protein-domain-containing protein [Podospora setosa]
MAKIPTTQVFQKGSVWMYNPSLPPAVLFLVLYFFAWMYITYLTFYRYKTWYITVIPLGALLEVAGYAVRIYSVKNLRSIVLTAPTQGAFIVSLTLHVLAPLLIAAGNYILLGRLITRCLPLTRQSLLKIPGRYITRIFVGFDILAAAIQGSGTSIAAAVNWTGLKALTGVDVLVAGLAVQVAGVGLFLGVLGRFEVLVRRLPGTSKAGGKGMMKRRGWEGLVVAVWVSSVLIFVSFPRD